MMGSSAAAGNQDPPASTSGPRIVRDLDRRRWLARGLAWSLAGWLCPHRSLAAGPVTFRLGVLVFPPFITEDGDKPDGILVQIWLRLAARLRVNTSITVLPPARLINDVAAGSIDLTLLPPGYPGLSENKLLSSDRPVEWVQMEAYTVGQTPPFTRWEDLAGRSVIIEHGYGYGGRIEWLMNPANRVTISAVVLNAEAGLRALVAGRGEILLHYQSMIASARQVVPVADLKAVRLTDLAIYVNLRSDFPDAALWMTRINAAIETDPLIRAHP